MSDMYTSSDADVTATEPSWGDAMTQQTAGSSDFSGMKNFPEELNLILDIPVRMTVELGRTKMTIKELLRLSQGSVVALDGLAGEPLDILINGYLIAQGEVVVVSDKFGVRITDIITPSERMHRLSR
ncbi:flagellar motor switch protein FliN/FliY [Pantoea agglomerans]|jgi:flagellar motor switch protein FliN/FliY|uniref:flagellar motor switch protein FliN n=1 Tax=Enterobacter agglomerans TaxID=549 RepID=UPI001049129E|nr:flagellar motor switch protein FliN [Pantoea agglomerans]MDQ0431101.1 flagellar motor switch protein FliN/FliY [Pantoea agglomerans]NEG84704.1 flagellar motor switch protein FliN [Pantoea agglomerans]NEH06845.1 flagellar motor switch protein FliN [Pantoea agglomerans]TCZ24222.1 flagellar motor switch protein FliN [Pantoea agglomerans]